MFPNFSLRLLSAGFSELFVYVVFGLFVCFETKSYKSFRFTSSPPFSCLAFQVPGLQVSCHAFSVYFYVSFSLRLDCLQSSGSALRICFASLTLYPTASGFPYQALSSRSVFPQTIDSEPFLIYSFEHNCHTTIGYHPTTGYLKWLKRAEQDRKTEKRRSQITKDHSYAQSQGSHASSLASSPCSAAKLS